MEHHWCLDGLKSVSLCVSTYILNYIHSYILEMPALGVFLGADAQLIGTSLAGARGPLVNILNHYFEYT